MGNVISIHSGPDPRELPNYSLSEAAAYLCIPRSTVSTWVRGQGRCKTVIALPDPHRPRLSFLNLVELHVLSAIRKHGHPMPNVRRALAYLEKQLGVKRPLCTQQFYSDGVGLFIEHLGTLIDTSRGGQTAIREAVQAYLTRIEYGQDGIASRLYPFTRRGATDDPRSVMFDPAISFGRLVIADTGIPTEEVADRYRAGETTEELATDFRVSREKIDEAIRCELHRTKAA